MTAPSDILNAAFARAANGNESGAVLTEAQHGWLITIVRQAELQKAVVAALMTSLVKKALTPTQDVRLHKVEMPNGYSGRVFDTAHVTPFIREKFPRLAMRSGSGWLTRSIEQNHAFMLDFSGKIQSRSVKEAFLNVLHDIEEGQGQAETYLVELLALLVRHTSASRVAVTATENRGQVTVSDIIELLKRHFFFDYHLAGASRLPVLALYAAYQLVMDIPRYAGKRLAPLKSHTTSDAKSRSVADVEILAADGSFWEGVEVKHGISITPTLVEDAYEKFAPTAANRFYLLTTAEPNVTDAQAIAARVNFIRQEHGCEVIVNGLLPSLKYYLRLLPDPSVFLSGYGVALQADYEANTDVKAAHIECWNALLAALPIADARQQEG